MANILLFIGVESYNWTISDFDKAIDFCKQHKLDGLVVKIYEITQGEWYQNLGGAKVVVDHIEAQGLQVLPYGYFYGNDRVNEIIAIQKYMVQYGKFCTNMETEFNGNQAGMQAYVDALVPYTGKWYVSTWADPEQQNWISNIQVAINRVDVWMPEAYNDYLVKTMYAQYPKLPVGKGIEPTFHVTQTPIADMNVSSNFTLWEYQDAIGAPNIVDDIVAQVKGLTALPIVKNNNNTIVDEFQVYQVEQNESFLECGPYAIALLKFGGVPGFNRQSSYSGITTTEWIDRWADHEYGIYSPTDVGSSIDNMHSYVTDAVDDFDRKDNHRLLHYWDIDTINDNSNHTDDIRRIKLALDAGYPVVVTTLMSSVQYPDGTFVYPGVGNYHIINIVGHVVEQGQDVWLVNDTDNPAQSLWPYHYLAWPMYLHWATIIQLVGPDPNNPWLAPIINGDPLTWPSGFNAQLFNIQQKATNQNMEKQFVDVWQSNLFKQPYGSGISILCHKLFMSSKIPAVFPLIPELDTVNWGGHPIKYQYLSNGYHVEWVNGVGHVYNNQGIEVA